MLKNVLVSFFVLTFLLSTQSPTIYKNVMAQDLPVHNVNTGKHYETIQKAIDDPETEDGHTIKVDSGTYPEHLIVNKSVTLTGSDFETTVIDGGGKTVVLITNTVNVAISGFTIKNATGEESCAIRIFNSMNTSVSDNVLKRSYYGVQLSRSNNTEIVNNVIMNNSVRGIDFRQVSTLNRIVGNTIAYNPIGVFIDITAKSNLFYHNNFINNTSSQVETLAPADWDNGAEGNYWSDYTGVDLYHGPYQNETGSDGIGDAEYVIAGKMTDKYPLMESWTLTRAFTVNSSQVVITCNCTVASFNFSQRLKQISFFITGPQNSSVFCNVTIPQDLLAPNSSQIWLVTLDSKNITATTRIIDNRTLINFTYSLSTHKVRIRVVEAPNIPPYADFTYFPTNPTTLDTVNFTDLSNDPDGEIVAWYWSFGDGTNSSKSTPSHNYPQKGTFQVTLTVTDDMNDTDIAWKTVTVTRMETTLTINVSPSVIAGEPVSIKALLKDQNGNPIPNEKIDFTFSENKTSSLIGSFLTNNTGVAAVTHTFSVAGEYLIRAAYNGSTKYMKNSVNVTLLVNLRPTVLSIDAPSSTTVGKKMKVTVILRDQNGTLLSNEIVDLLVHEGDKWTKVDSATTNSSGVAVFIYTPKNIGIIQIRADFQKTEVYDESHSNVVALNVDKDYTRYIVVTAIVVVAIAAIVFGILINKRKRLNMNTAEKEKVDSAAE